MPRRVTLVANEIRGFRPAGGLGTATTYLALALARMGHSVEILLGMHSPGAIDPHWESVYRSAGVRLRPVPDSDEPVEPPNFVLAHKVGLALRSDPPDVVVVHDLGGPAYTALRLRQAGIACANTLFVVFCHGTRRYAMDLAGRVRVKDLRHVLAVAVNEQASVELADVVVSPSQYLVDWMRGQGWRLPERTLVIPYLTQASATGEPVERRPVIEGQRVERLVFFGRLDERKGLKLFAAGLNALEPHLLHGVEVEFLGKTSATWTRARIEALLAGETKRALRQVSFSTELDQHEALARLRRRGTLAVMPSLQENSPNAVYECLEHGIPFVASDVGGVSELIASDDHDRVLFEPTAAGVEAVLRRVLSAGCVPRPAEPARSIETAYVQWEEVIETRPQPQPDVTDGPVDVVVVRRSSGGNVARCVAALERQRYRDFQVTIGEGSSVAAARQAGLDKGSAPYVLFLDSDDIPDPELLATLLRAQATSGADVVSCGLRVHTEDGQATLHFFGGRPGGLGALTNQYGSVALYRRRALDRLAGDYPADADPEWPLLARLAARGAQIVSVPTPLVMRTARPATIETHRADALLAVEQLEQALPPPLRATARLAAGLAAATTTPTPITPRIKPLRSIARRLLRGVR